MNGEDQTIAWLTKMKRSLEASLNDEKEMSLISAEDRHTLDEYYPYICGILETKLQASETRH